MTILIPHSTQEKLIRDLQKKLLPQMPAKPEVISSPVIKAATEPVKGLETTSKGHFDKLNDPNKLNDPDKLNAQDNFNTNYKINERKPMTEHQSKDCFWYAPCPVYAEIKDSPCNSPESLKDFAAKITVVSFFDYDFCGTNLNLRGTITTNEKKYDLSLTLAKLYLKNKEPGSVQINHNDLAQNAKALINDALQNKSIKNLKIFRLALTASLPDKRITALQDIVWKKLLKNS